MQSRQPQPRLGVLVLGEPHSANACASALRTQGFTVWVVTTESELRWVADQSRLRPSVSLVLMPAESGDAPAKRRHLAYLAARAGLPSVLLGKCPDAELFANIVSTLPPGVEAHTIADALGQAVRAPQGV